MSKITAEEITKIIYQNSSDNSEGLIIKFENIQDVLAKLEKAMQEHTKQNIAALRLELKDRKIKASSDSIDTVINKFLENIK